MKPARDEDGRIVREGYSTRDGYQDDPGKPDDEGWTDLRETLSGDLVRQAETIVEHPPGSGVYTSPPAREVPGTYSAFSTRTMPDGREAFEGLLAFVTTRRGELAVVHLGTSWEGWRVEVRWESIARGPQKVFAEDRSFDEACLACRGLLAHALASGVATP